MTSLQRVVLKKDRSNLKFNFETFSLWTQQTMPMFSFPFSGKFWRRLPYFSIFLSVVSANFHPITVKDHVIAKEVYRVFKTKDWMSCLMECNADSKCSSYNFQREADSCPGHICELSKCAMNEKREKGLIARPGFIFQQLKPSQVKSFCYFSWAQLNQYC